DKNELALYRARTLDVIARPPADWPPQHVTFRGDRAYVTSGWTGSLRVYGSDGRSLRRTIVPVGSYNVQQADGWVVNQGLGNGSLCVLDPRGRQLRRERVARSSADASEHPGAGDPTHRRAADSSRVHLRRVGHQARVDRGRGQEQHDREDREVPAAVPLGRRPDGESGERERGQKAEEDEAALGAP